MAVYISFYTYIHIHFFINLIVKSIETFVVCAVSRIKLLLLLLLLLLCCFRFVIPLQFSII